MTELTAEIISRLSPGAAKLYLAYLYAPGATDAQARDITSYKSRWFKKLRDELVEAGLLAAQAEELSAEAQRCEAELRSVGVDAAAARNLASACPPEMVQNAVAYVRGRRDIANPAGYVVRSLREKLKASKDGIITPNLSRIEPFRGDMQKGQDSAGVARGFPPYRTDLPKEAERSEAYSVERREGKPDSNTVAPGRSYRRFVQGAGTLDVAMLDTEFQLLLFTLQATCGCDPVLNPTDLDDAYRLYCAQYRARHIERFVREVWPQCWPGNKGERLTIPWLLKLIGFTRSHGMPVAQEASAPSGDSPYLADPYFADKQGDHVAELSSCGDRAASICVSIPAQVESAWRSTVGLLKTQVKGWLNEYDNWLAHVEIVAYTDGILRLAAPHPYIKDWIERHLLSIMRKLLNEALLSCRFRQDDEKEIEIDMMLGDPCPRCGQLECVCPPIPARVRDMWLATMGSLQIQLKRSTYETWLRHLQLVAFSNDVLQLEVPHQYAKDYLERHLLASMTRLFNDYYCGGADASRRIRQDREIQIVIRSEGGR